MNLVLPIYSLVIGSLLLAGALRAEEKEVAKPVVPPYPFTRTITNDEMTQLQVKIVGRTAGEVCFYLLNDRTRRHVLYPIRRLSPDDQTFLAAAKIGGDIRIESPEDAAFRQSAEDEIAGVELKLAEVRAKAGKKGVTSTQKQALNKDAEILANRLKDLKKRLKERLERSE